MEYGGALGRRAVRDLVDDEPDRVIIVGYLPARSMKFSVCRSRTCTTQASG
jgi:hypothetical protein